MSTMPTQLYAYRARPIRVVDGDTIDVTLSLGLHDYRDERLRLLGVNCPEVHGASKVAGDAATAFTRAWLAMATGDWPLVLVTAKSDEFGRYLATVWRTADGACLNDDLLAAGHAVPFMVRA